MATRKCIGQMPSLPAVKGYKVRHVQGWPGYAVSSNGIVFSCRISGFREWRRLKQQHHQGYLHVTLRNIGKYRTAKVCRLVLETFVGPKQPGMVCRHLDDNRTNNVLSNLKWGTNADNIQDAIRNNTFHSNFPRGLAHPKAKLTHDMVRAIRALDSIVPQKVLALWFGVTQRVISLVMNRKTWNHVPEVKRTWNKSVIGSKNSAAFRPRKS